MWRGETICLTVVHLFDRLSQLSTLVLTLQARGQRRERDDPQVDVGRRGGSGGRESGTQVRLGCREVDSRRLHWTAGTHVVLSSSSSVEPTTFSSVSISSPGRECGPYLRHFGAFGGAIIVGAFVVVAVVTATRMYANRREGGEPFVVEAFRRSFVATTYLEMSKRPFSSAERRGTAGLQPAPVVLGRLTVGQSAQRGCETEFECRRSLPGQGRRWCGSVKASHSRGRVASVGV